MGNTFIIFLKHENQSKKPCRLHPEKWSRSSNKRAATFSLFSVLRGAGHEKEPLKCVVEDEPNLIGRGGERFLFLFRSDDNIGNAEQPHKSLAVDYLFFAPRPPFRVGSLFFFFFFFRWFFFCLFFGCRGRLQTPLTGSNCRSTLAAAATLLHVGHRRCCCRTKRRTSSPAAAQRPERRDAAAVAASGSSAGVTSVRSQPGHSKIVERSAVRSFSVHVSPVRSQWFSLFNETEPWKPGKTR